MGVVNFSIPKDLVLEIKAKVTIDNFIETGTYKGDTAFWAADFFNKVYTIEISPDISKETASRKGCPDNVEFIVGDSRMELAKLMQKVKGRSFFWLDGHWCADAGGKDAECPLLDELIAISTCEKPVIFIDDARCFLGPLPPPHNFQDWPAIDEIFAFCKNHFPNSYTTIIDDVIVSVPEDVKPIINNYWIKTFNKRYYGFVPQKGLGERFLLKGKSILKNKLKILQSSQTSSQENQKIQYIKTNKWLIDRNIQTILDIGANTGQFATKARILFPDAKIYSFEPIPSVYEKLKENFSNDVNFKAFNIALGEEKGEISFFQNEFSDSSSCLKMKDNHKEVFPYTTNESEIKVKMTTLDEAINTNDISSPYLVKLDVQGFEEKVINGGQNIIQNADFIITEVSFVELYENQPLFAVLYEKLTGMSFRYIGNFEQLYSPLNNEILQADAIFQKVK